MAMRRFTLILTVAASAVVLASCGTESTEPGDTGDTGEPDSIADRAFILDEATGPTALVPDQTIRFWFDGDALRISDGCNGLGGQFVVTDGILQVTGSLPATEIGCPPEYLEQAEWLDALIRSEPSVTWDDEHLTLTAEEAELTFIDESIAVPDRPLTGTVWQVEDVTAGAGPDAGVTSVRGETELVFADDGTLSFSICNSGRGSYELEGDTVRFSEVISTRMACSDTRGDAENAFNALIAATDGATLEIDGDRLILTGPEGGLGLRAVGDLTDDAADGHTAEPTD